MPSSGVQTCADRKSTRLNSSHTIISYAVFCLKKKQSDTVILAHLPGTGKSGQRISCPRDGLVEIPKCDKWKGGSGVSTPRRDKFNVAFQFGGPACTIKTVEQSSGIKANDFIIVSLPGFVKISNALGGVDVCLPKAVADPNA